MLHLIGAQTYCKCTGFALGFVGQVVDLTYNTDWALPLLVAGASDLWFRLCAISDFRQPPGQSTGYESWPVI